MGYGREEISSTTETELNATSKGMVKVEERGVEREGKAQLLQKMGTATSGVVNFSGCKKPFQI